MESEKIKRYDKPQRAFHWVNLLALLILLGTGLTIFDLSIIGFRPFSALAQTLIGEVYNPLIFDLHRYAAFTLLGAFIFHLAYDTGIRGIFWSELPGRSDFKGFTIMAKNFLGLSNEYIKFHKYNPGQKMVHIGIAIVVVLIGATGFMLSADYRWIIPVWWLNIDFDFLLFWARALHDLLTFVLVALVIMHFYFAVRKENFPTFVSMISGWVSKDYQEKHFSKTEEPEIIQSKERLS